MVARAFRLGFISILIVLFLPVIAVPAAAQNDTVAGPYTVITLAGTAGSADGIGSAARFDRPSGVAVDSAGTVYVADRDNSTIRKITPAGVVTTLAGLALNPGSADGTGSAARFNDPSGLAVDSAGTVYVADRLNCTIRKITPAGVVTTLAGSGSAGSADGTGSAAQFTYPGGVAVDGGGTVYVADTFNQTIRKITPAGVVSTLAGLAGSFDSVDGTGSAARFNYPWGVAVDGAGTVYVADTNNSTIRTITPAGVVSTLAGLALAPGSTDGAGGAARFNLPRGVAVDSAGTVYVADTVNQTIRKITPTRVVSTLAGLAVTAGTTDGTGSAARFSGPSGVAVDSAGSLYVADSYNDTIRTITPAGAVSSLAGLARSAGSADGTGSTARFYFPYGVAADSAGTVYVADTYNHTIRKITPTGVVTTLAGLIGSSGSADGNGSAARFHFPSGIAVDSAGTVYVADTDNGTIRKITPAGVVTTLAGQLGSGSTDGTGSAARFNVPEGIAVDSAGTVYVADTYNSTIRKVTPAGIVTTLAGQPPSSPFFPTGGRGSADGTGSAARFNLPKGVAVDGDGTLYVADSGNNTIRKITPAPEVTTLAGLAGTSGGADGTGSTARFFGPWGVAVDSAGTIYVADSDNDTIRTVTPAGVVSTLAGQAGSRGSADGVASAARFAGPVGVAVDAAGTLYIADSGNHTIRKGTPAVDSLTVNPTALRFAATKAGSTGALQQVTPAQVVRVNVSGRQGAWSASADQPWVQVTNGSGNGSGQMTIGIVNPSDVIDGSTSLTANVYVNTVTPLGSGISNLTATIPITLTVLLSGSGSAPFGAFDTPAEGATNVTGSIAVTGWALDDIGVSQVKLWRNCVEAIDRPAGACFAAVPGGPPNFVFIGNGVFLSGARSDVETAFSSHPQTYRAGWGYLMMTNALPHLPNGTAQGGQGQFTLSAYAVDQANFNTLLGTKTITLNNDNATIPFGALDTPEQGGTVTASVYADFGWAMTQNPKCVDTTTTASYRVYIDGVSRPLTPGTNWFAGLTRSDIAAAFPGRCNTNNALAAYYIDKTALGLPNGLHTIGWDVIDDGGNTAGIGSRSFNLQVGSSLLASDTLTDRPVALAPASALASLSPADRLVQVHVGPGEGPFERLEPDTSRRYAVQVPANGRVAIDLGGPVDTGYQLVMDELRAMPGGSTLSPSAGQFAWQPPAPYLGPFHLVFVGGGERLDLIVTLVDPTVLSDIRLQIDTPAADVTVSRSFVVAGWALDPGASSGSGIDTLHVWAYRRDAIAAPEFLGAAAVGGVRPDVAAAFGAQFEAAGFTLTTPPLAPGIYDLLVYPWSHRTAQFEPAHSVRVIVR